MRDDLVDEDVFRALENGNVTILVDTEPRETTARYSLVCLFQATAYGGIDSSFLSLDLGEITLELTIHR